MDKYKEEIGNIYQLLVNDIHNSISTQNGNLITDNLNQLIEFYLEQSFKESTELSRKIELYSPYPDYRKLYGTEEFKDAVNSFIFISKIWSVFCLFSQYTNSPTLENLIGNKIDIKIMTLLEYDNINQIIELRETFQKYVEDHQESKILINLYNDNVPEEEEIDMIDDLSGARLSKMFWDIQVMEKDFNAFMIETISKCLNAKMALVVNKLQNR